MVTRTPLGQALYDSIAAANAAEEAFCAALVAQFGRKAVDRRYSYQRGDWGPDLVAAHSLKAQAQEVQHAAFRALAAGGELP